MPTTNRSLTLLQRATAALPAALLFLTSGAGAIPLEEEPPARMVPICFAHLDKAIGRLQDADSDEEALYRGREVFRNWMSKHPANPTAPAPRTAAETIEDMGFCRRIGAVMFQFAKPQESAAMVRKANATRAADAAQRGKEKPAQ